MDRGGRRERRHHPRAPILGTATVRWDRIHEATYLIANLSSGGAQIFGTRPIPVGTRAEIVLHLGRRHVYRIDATVMRVNATGIDDVHLAVAFVGSASDVAGALQSEVAVALEHAPVERSSALVVEASDGDRQFLAGDLHTLGRTVFAVAVPSEAVEYVSHPKARVDVALVALAGECAEGIDLLVLVADRHPGARRIILAAEIDEHLARSTELVGGCVTLRKPWNLPELAHALGD